MPKAAEKRKPARRVARSGTDWARLRAMSEEEIEHNATSDPDAQPVSEKDWLRGVQVVMPQPKSPVYIRLDRDVLAFFKKAGRRYQTRINAVLKAYVNAHEKKQGKRRSK